ncbi:MAG: metal-dependent hydrolase [Planctomycetota bacterium]|nr:metal-dependent hydrolase [Planctomycetota bacterium]
MDTPTQALIGATAAQLVLGPRLGHRAWIVGAAAGALPDADVFLQPFADPALPWELHRHFTHALVMAPVMGLLAALPFFLFKSMRKDAKLVIAAAIVATFTHGPLDWCTTFGTKILWPFSMDGYTGDLFPIVDPLFSIALLVGVIAAARGARRWPAVATWAFIGLYTAAALFQQGNARELQQTLADRRGHTMERARVMPAPGSLLVWRSIYEQNGTLHADLVRTAPFAEPTYLGGGNTPLISVEEAVARVPEADRPRARDVLERFGRFAEGYLAWTPDGEPVVGDMRITSDAGFESIWGIRLAAKPGEPTVAWEMRRARRDGWVTALLETIVGTRAGLKPVAASPRQTSP